MNMKDKKYTIADNGEYLTGEEATKHEEKEYGMKIVLNEIEIEVVLDMINDRLKHGILTHTEQDVLMDLKKEIENYV